MTVDGAPVKPEVYASYTWTFSLGGYAGSGSLPAGAGSMEPTLNARMGHTTMALPLVLPTTVDAGMGD